MAIRDKNLQFTDEALILDTQVRQALRPIYNDYKDSFTAEEIQYIVVNAISQMITRDFVERKLVMRIAEEKARKDYIE